MGKYEEEEPRFYEYWEIDETGHVIENYFWDQKRLQQAIDEGRTFVNESWGEGLYEPIYDRETRQWKEGKDPLLLLEMAKESKRSELDEACNEAILGGFEHEINGTMYHFSYDTEAQMNFNDGAQVLNQGLVAELLWTVYNPSGAYERIVINKELMNEITNTIILHKQGMISKYRDELLPLVEAATTIEEIEAIKWDMVV
jgi:hypothetical protein